jgi:hypothetical protein
MRETMQKIKLGKISIITEEVITALNLDIEPDTPIYISGCNLAHIMKRHPVEFKKYGKDIEEILAHPTYIGSVSAGSIEYVKEYPQILPQKSIFIMLVVKVSKKGIFYVCTLYRIKNKIVINFINKGTLKAIDKVVVMT